MSGLNNKGSLQLSVGAIITLIIAVAVLGLVIGFVATQFDSVSQRITLTEETPEPTASTPITFPGGRSSLTLSKNSEYQMNIKVYNPSTSLLSVSGSAGSGVTCSNFDNQPGPCSSNGCTYNVNTASDCSGDAVCNPHDSSDQATCEAQTYNLGFNTCVWTDGTGTCTGATGSIMAVCGESAIGTNLTIGAPLVEIQPGRTGEVPALIRVDGLAPTGRTPCTFTIGSASRSVFVTVE